MAAAKKQAPEKKPIQPVNAASITPRELVKNLATRLGLPLLGVWLLAAFIRHWAGFAVAGALTVAAIGLVLWALRRIDKAKKVANILQGAQAEGKEGRKAAIEKIDAEFGKGDVAATFAKAQLMMQDSPDEALALLETVDLTKVLPAEADQARFQRAMILLAKGDTEKARPLVDGIDLTRQEDPKTRAVMGAVVAEGWARTGQAAKAIKTLDLFDENDETFSDIRPQMWRARAFAAAGTSDTKAMKQALRKLLKENPQYLSGFLVKRVHPLLEREAKQLLLQSGAVPRKMQVKRL